MKKPPMRLWVGIVGIFFTVFVAYIILLNLSILIVAMVKSKGKYTPPACNPKKPPPKENKVFGGIRYPWSEEIQGQILAAYGYGFISTSILGGFLAEMFGPWKVILLSNIICGCLVGVTGLSARIHYGFVIAIRVIFGLTGGVLYPAVQCLIAKWAPPKEMSKFVALLMGNTIGSIFVLFTGGLIAEMASYDVAYIFFGTCVLIFCIFFGIFVSNDPQSHKWISEEERNFILTEQEGKVTAAKAVPPYKKILTNLRVWAAILAEFGNMWGLFFQMTSVPKFLAEVLGFELKSAGGLAALPYLARFIAGVCFGFLGDYLLKNEKMSKTALRKTFTIFSHIIPAIMVCMIYLFKCNIPAVVSMLIFSLMFNGAVVITVLQNPLDLAPNFAGTIYGIMQTFGAIPGFMVPLVVAVFTKHKKGIDEWKWNFIISGVICASGGVIFIIFGSADLQAFNTKKEDTGEKENA